MKFQQALLLLGIGPFGNLPFANAQKLRGSAAPSDSSQVFADGKLAGLDNDPIVALSKSDNGGTVLCKIPALEPIPEVSPEDVITELDRLENSLRESSRLTESISSAVNEMKEKANKDKSWVEKNGGNVVGLARSIFSALDQFDSSDPNQHIQGAMTIVGAVSKFLPTPFNTGMELLSVVVGGIFGRMSNDPEVESTESILRRVINDALAADNNEDLERAFDQEMRLIEEDFHHLRDMYVYNSTQLASKEQTIANTLVSEAFRNRGISLLTAMERYITNQNNQHTDGWWEQNDERADWIAFYIYAYSTMITARAELHCMAAGILQKLPNQSGFSEGAIGRSTRTLETYARPALAPLSRQPGDRDEMRKVFGAVFALNDSYRSTVETLMDQLGTPIPGTIVRMKALNHETSEYSYLAIDRAWRNVEVVAHGKGIEASRESLFRIYGNDSTNFELFAVHSAEYVQLQELFTTHFNHRDRCGQSTVGTSNSPFYEHGAPTLGGRVNYSCRENRGVNRIPVQHEWDGTRVPDLRRDMRYRDCLGRLDVDTYDNLRQWSYSVAQQRMDLIVPNECPLVSGIAPGDCSSTFWTMVIDENWTTRSACRDNFQVFLQTRGTTTTPKHGFLFEDANGLCSEELRTKGFCHDSTTAHCNPGIFEGQQWICPEFPGIHVGNSCPTGWETCVPPLPSCNPGVFEGQLWRCPQHPEILTGSGSCPTRWETCDFTAFADNVALQKPTTQSSTASGGVSSRAVDGNRNGNWRGGSITHTSNEPSPWWEVDLEASYNVDYVYLYNRWDCCSDRLRDARVALLDANDSILVWKEMGPIFHPVNIVDFTDATYMVSKVRVWLRAPGHLSGNSPAVLSLAEVEVYPSLTLPANNNVALGKSATQSSTGWGGVASRAVDGNRNGFYNSGSVTHTAGGEQNTWWEVDLDGNYNIDKVHVFNRVDSCCFNRLEGAVVKLLDNEDSVVAEKPVGELAAEMILDFSETSTTASKVQVWLPPGGVLSLAEVEVYAADDKAN